MSGNDVLDVSRETIWVMIQIASPLLLVALIVGLIVSLIQALTQIQEMTLTFVPKVLAIFFAMTIFFPFMGRSLGAFTIRLFDRIVALS